MKEITLSNSDKVALVDDADFEYLNQFRWNLHTGNATDYAVRHALKENGKQHQNKKVLMHRDLMTPPQHLHVDHINHNGLDNRRENLRLVTNRENHQNPKRKNITGYLGVVKSWSKFRAHIRVGNRMLHLGTFETALEAHKAYMDAYKRLRVIDNITYVQNREV